MRDDNTKPRVTLVCGLPGSGKTTFARALERDTGAIRFSPDEWIVRLLATPDHRPEMDRLREPVEAIQWEHARALLRRGIDVILENGFWSRGERLAYAREAGDCGASVELVYLAASIPRLKARLTDRNRHRARGSFHVDPDELDSWIDVFEAPDRDEGAHYDAYRALPQD